MSRYDFSAGDEATSAKLNKALRAGSYNAGETISGDTLPVACYQNTTDNEFYACDANDTDKMKFIGFGISNGTDGNSIDIQFNGIVNGFTGLSEGEKYYVQDDKTIGTTPGTYNILVGEAISETELVISVDLGVGRGIYSVASDNLKASSDGEVGQGYSAALYVLVETIQILVTGTMRIKFDMKTGASEDGDGKLYKNGVAIGTNHYLSDETTYQTYSEDISAIADGDLIQIYGRVGNSGHDIYFRNFRIYFDILSGYAIP